MKNQYSLKALAAAVTLIVLSAATFAQRSTPKATAAKTAKSIIFAVVNDGAALEPIAYVSKGKLEAPVSGSDDENVITAFIKSYYKTNVTYRLIFGGADAGTVTVKSADAAVDCGKNMADVTTHSTKTSIKGLVMGLATNVPVKNKTSGFRRKPTVAEKAEIDALAKAEFAKHKLTPKALRFQNLTAIDVDGDGKPEFVGSYWVEIDKFTRGLLFFIADRHSNGKLALDYTDYNSVDRSSTMSKDIADVDNGIYHELLLDYFDYNGSGTAEIFTYKQSFEGAGFAVYRRSGGKWIKAFEGSNYHCGY